MIWIRKGCGMEVIEFPATALVARIDVAGGNAVSVYRVQDAVIAGQGLVLDRAGRIYRPSIGNASLADLERASDAVQVVDIPVLPGKAILCKQSGIADYGRWLLEILPICWLTRRHPLLTSQKLIDATFIVADASEPLRHMMIESLGLLGNPLAIAGFVPDMVLRVADLVVVDGLADAGGAVSPLSISACQDLTANLPVGPPQFLFVSRSGTDLANFADSDAADAAAWALGWTVIYPGRRDARTELALFKGAIGIVGIVGGGLANMVVARPGTRVVGLLPTETAGSLYQSIAQLRGLRYEEVPCAHADSGGGLAMSIAELSQILRRIMDDIVG